MIAAPLVRLSETQNFPTVTLQRTAPHGYILLAADVDRRPPFGYIWESRRKRKLLKTLKIAAEALARRPVVAEATVFKALVVPPGRGLYLRKRPDAHVARYDVAILIAVHSHGNAQALLESPAYQTLERVVTASTSAVYRMVGENIRSIAPVDHRKAGVFLFNYFLAANEAQNIAVWDYTAGWFQDQTGLDNSLLLRPVAQRGAHYTIVNHCRWDRLTDILPSLLFKPSFRSYVLRHFEANDTAAMPILYRLA